MCSTSKRMQTMFVSVWDYLSNKPLECVQAECC